MYFGLEGPILDAESNILETTFTRVLSQEMASLQHSLPGPCGIVDLLGCGSLDSFLGDIEYEVYDSSCLNDWASKQWSEQPWPVGWPTTAHSARCLSTKTSLYGIDLLIV